MAAWTRGRAPPAGRKLLCTLAPIARVHRSAHWVIGWVPGDLCIKLNHMVSVLGVCIFKRKSIANPFREARNPFVMGNNHCPSLALHLLMLWIWGFFWRGSFDAGVPAENPEHGSWGKATVAEAEPRIFAHLTFPWFAEGPCNPKLVSVKWLVLLEAWPGDVVSSLKSPPLEDSAGPTHTFGNGSAPPAGLGYIRSGGSKKERAKKNTHSIGRVSTLTQRNCTRHN